MTFRRSLLAALAASAAAPAALAQSARRRGGAEPPAPAPQGEAHPIGIVTGNIEAASLRLGADLATVLDGPGMRVLPIVGKGSLQNLGDLLHVRDVDLATTAMDSLTYATDNNVYPGLAGNVRYITKLYDQEMHLLAGPDIRTVEDLRGKTVNIDLQGSGTWASALLLFKLLNIPVTFAADDQAKALQRLKRGEIAAVAQETGKPVGLLNRGAPEGTHFVPIPYGVELGNAYVPATLTHDDYPKLIPEGEKVRTVASSVVLVCFNWAPDTERYRGLARFTNAFFSRFPELLVSPRHPKWHETNFRAEVPGLVRFQPATEWLQRDEKLASQGLDAKFQTFLDSIGQQELSSQRKAQLYRAFQELQQRR